MLKILNKIPLVNFVLCFKNSESVFVTLQKKALEKNTRFSNKDFPVAIQFSLIKTPLNKRTVVEINSPLIKKLILINRSANRNPFVQFVGFQCFLFPCVIKLIGISNHYKNALTGNRTRVKTMATFHSTSKLLMQSKQGLKYSVISFSLYRQNTAS